MEPNSTLGVSRCPIDQSKDASQPWESNQLEKQSPACAVGRADPTCAVGRVDPMCAVGRVDPTIDEIV